jgi:DNA mismatch endonuclease (patch repair protein)
VAPNGTSGKTLKRYGECVTGSPRGGQVAQAGGPDWEPTADGAHLRGRTTRNTQPEVALRKAVHAHGLRFRLNRRVGRYRPDFVLPRHHLAVFVDGCFWHNCPEHGPREFRGPNAARWQSKRDANRARDLAANAALAKAGWKVLRIWECETRADVDAAAMKVLGAVQSDIGDAITLRAV